MMTIENSNTESVPGRVDELDYLALSRWIKLEERFFVWPGVSRMRFTVAITGEEWHVFWCVGGFARPVKRWICILDEVYRDADSAKAALADLMAPYEADMPRWRAWNKDPRNVRRFWMREVSVRSESEA